MEIFDKFFALQQSEGSRRLGLETQSQYRERWISIRVIYYMGFLIYFAFGVVATMLWPYLNTLDPNAGKVFLAYVFAIPAVLQLIFSPAFGWWKNKVSSIRLPMTVLLIAFIGGHVLYATLECIPTNRKYMLVLSRGFVGLSSVSCTIYRAYISSATAVAERTKTMSYLSLAQTAGLLAGSAMQPIFSILGEDGILVFGVVHFNMYTSIGWFCALLGCVNLVLMQPFIFKDHNIAVREAMKTHNTALSKDLLKTLELRYLPIGLMCMAFAWQMFTYSGFQT
ncbi:major facilitator superfamily domain-containing protein 8-like [Sabethes cyaneus]|uniref:major facilitator superfamily domain-containing protein 8-like n=1 Tax=Sabethes cyaneus TaxID=53552 RepID=UPI00237DA58A|nr:major facilitator superfamily domain-containing protein 8-like [Sabethes cyaneus]